MCSGNLATENSLEGDYGDKSVDVYIAGKHEKCQLQSVIGSKSICTD